MPQPFERHARPGTWDYDSSQPGRADETRAAAAADAAASGPDPLPARQPSRKKDTSHWCRGKQGQAHQPALRGSGCAWIPEWQKVEGVYRYVTKDGTPLVRWWCRHEEVCARCGKKLRWRIPAEHCPLRPGDPAQKKEAEAKALAYQERRDKWTGGGLYRRSVGKFREKQGYRKQRDS